MVAIVRGILRKIRTKMTRLAAFLRNVSVEKYQADYSSDSFFSCLEHSGVIESASDARLKAETKQACVFENYFDKAQSRKFFHGPTEIMALAKKYHRNYPHWCSRTLSQVESEHRSGYFTYALRTGPLVQGYNWNGHTDTPGRDIQFRKKSHRFSFLPRMVIAATSDLSVLIWIREILSDWVDYAGSARGELAFDSNLAVIQRLMSCCWSWLILRSIEGHDTANVLRLTLLKIIRVDIQFLAPRLGTSYANNHLLADYFCGWLITRLFPEFALGSIDATVDFEQRWVDELLRQTYDDGGSFEQSSHYHEFASDLALSYVLISRANGWRVPEEVSRRVEAMMHFQSSLGGEYGVPVEFGDCIQDNFFSLGVHAGLGPALYREVYRSLFQGQLCASRTDVPAVEAAFWLLGGLAPVSEQDTPDVQVQSAEFLSCGVITLQDPDSSMNLVFRTGPKPGVAVMAGHAHSDLLNVTLAVAGRPLVVPSGTFTYRSQPAAWPKGEPSWRHYFRGPESGNGVVMMGEDPLGKVIAGDFRNKHTSARVASSVKSTLPLAYSVEGELLDVPGFTHYRRGVVHLQGMYTVVYDVHPVDGILHHDSIQFAPDACVVHKGKTLIASVPGSSLLYLHFDNSYTSAELHSGSIRPLAGWVSTEYGQRVEAPHVHRAYQSDAVLSCKLISVSTLEGTEVDIVSVGSDILLKCEIHGFSDRLILGSSRESKLRTCDSIQTDADLLWMRRCESAPSEIRAANVSVISISNTLQISCIKREEWVIVHFFSGNVKVITASGVAPEIS